jgi:hypothetical protein
VVSKEIGLEVNAGAAKYMVMSPDQTAGRSHSKKTDNTSQQDFIPRKVYCVSNVTFHAESKYAIKIFPSPTGFVQRHFLLLIFRNFS